MDATQQNLVSRAGQLCAQLLKMSGEIEQIDILFNGDAHWDLLITDAAIADVASFNAAGLTAANVAAAIFVLKEVRGKVRDVNLAAMVMMGNLG